MLEKFSWQGRPALIETNFPVQKLSAESYKEQMAVHGKTLTSVGGYWKGRKPLILNRACLLGCLLPATEDAIKDLRIFDLLMAMDEESMSKRIKAKSPSAKNDKINSLLKGAYNEQVQKACRPEEMDADLSEHIWQEVNNHLGTCASTISEIVEEMGNARFGRRPKAADVFSGSGQIPFELSRIGCDTFASDLSPIACMLTWGNNNIVGASNERREVIKDAQESVAAEVQQQIDSMGIENDNDGWEIKNLLYCLEVTCPETGWKVPVLSTKVISKKDMIVARLAPETKSKSYKIATYICESKDEFNKLGQGTYQKGELIHSIDGKTETRVNIATIRGDHKVGKVNKNNLRLWDKHDFIPQDDDIYQERLYCIHWCKKNGNRWQYDYRSVSQDDLEREKIVEDYVRKNLQEWQENGLIPDIRIERGYNTDQPIRERGWCYWHHLFNPRQLLMLALTHKAIKNLPDCQEELQIFMAAMLNRSSKLCIWNTGSRNSEQVFYNQALNTPANYGCRSFSYAKDLLTKQIKGFPSATQNNIINQQACEIDVENDIYITDPPYGDAVKYEEIYEFFIAWFRKNPPAKFKDWVWDSRRSVAIKGEDDNFTQAMIKAYKATADNMPDNGIQVLMFTHNSTAIWSDMANIIWASGLRVTAAWYIVTESDCALRQGDNIKGTIMLVLRKRIQGAQTFQDELSWEIEQAVSEQVESLVATDKSMQDKGCNSLYTDADMQMAGYAAALKVLTSYDTIDGCDMTKEAARAKSKDKSFVDNLIDFAVQTAVQFLVPIGYDKNDWQNLMPAERFYLKMAQLEAAGEKKLDNYQNFAKAFKMPDYGLLLSQQAKANSANTILSTELEGAQMSGASALAVTPLRSLLYAFYEVSKKVPTADILHHLMDNCPNYMQNRSKLIHMASFLAEKREMTAEKKGFDTKAEASAARILAQALENQKF